MKTKLEIVGEFFSPSGLKANSYLITKYLTREDALKVSKMYHDGSIPSKRKARDMIGYYMGVRRKELLKRDRIRKGYL